MCAFAIRKDLSVGLRRLVGIADTALVMATW